VLSAAENPRLRAQLQSSHSFPALSILAKRKRKKNTIRILPIDKRWKTQLFYAIIENESGSFAGRIHFFPFSAVIHKNGY